MPSNTAVMVKLDWGFWVLLAVLIAGLALWGILGTESGTGCHQTV